MSLNGLLRLGFVLSLTLGVALFVGSVAVSHASVGPPLKHVAYPYLLASPTSGSMEPTIHCATRGKHCQAKVADQLLEEESGATLVHRGDIIAFRDPPTRANSRYCVPGSGPVSHRVIGVGGDLVIEKRGVVTIYGRKIHETYVPKAERGNESGSWLVPKGSFFVMGDNRAISCDSRVLGPVERSDVLGRIVEIIRRSPGGSDPVGPPIKHVRFPYALGEADTAAMAPTIQCAKPGRSCTAKFNDQLLLELSGGSLVHRGDLVQFLLPRSATHYCGSGGALERVIGLSGELVSERRGTIYINGRALPEPYVPRSERDSRSGHWRVPQNSVFVMADFRAHSCDSRFWGSVPRSRVQGHVVEIIRRDQ